MVGGRGIMGWQMKGRVADEWWDGRGIVGWQRNRGVADEWWGGRRIVGWQTKGRWGGDIQY